MQKPPTKAEIRSQLQKAVEDFMGNGGKVEQVPSGVSGRDHGQRPINTPLFDSPRATRTYVTELVADIDARRTPNKSTPAKPTTTKKPRQKTLYDDFGEPIRKIWVQE